MRNHSNRQTVQVFMNPCKNKRAGPSEKGAYGFPEVKRAIDVDDIIYDVKVDNSNMRLRRFSKIAKHLFSKVFDTRLIKAFTVFEC